MVERYGEDARCWSHYIQQCIECNTFTFSEKLRKDPSCKIQSEKLINKIYKMSLSKSLAPLKPLDSILKAYKRVFEELKGCKSTKILLSSNQGARLSWKMEDYETTGEDEEEDGYSPPIEDVYDCVLDIYKYRKAKGIPLDSSKQIVKIRGLKNRRGAFNGDTVKVGVFKESPAGKCFGRVQEVTRRGGNLKFICRVSNFNPIVFYPIDEKNPILINLPRLSRSVLKKKKRTDINDMDLESQDVVVFIAPQIDENNVEEVPLPQIKQVIPLSVAKNMLFLVSFVKWDLKYRSPLGIVEGVFPKGFTRYFAERLLTFEHGVDYNDSNTAGESVTCVSVPQDKQRKLYSKAFTIDPEGAQNLDDALSITQCQTTDDGQAVYKVGVHIVNAAKHIKPDTSEDSEARNIGISMYGGGKKVMHMLASQTLRSQLSLMPDKIRDVISVTCLVTLNQNSKEIAINSVEINEAQVKSVMQLTYKSAQQILMGTIPREHSKVACLFDSLNLCDSMKLLYDIALAMRLRRMQSDAAYAYDVSDPGEEECWQTHLLVEELMIWANNEVAKKLLASHPDAAILRKQSPPNRDKMQELVSTHESVMANSLSLAKYLTPEQVANPSPILVPVDILQNIERALKDGDFSKLAYNLFTNKRYPQLAAVESEVHSIMLPAEYCSIKKDRDLSEYRHDGLMLNSYTHFSSPMRRYCDIQVQRMLLECLKPSPLQEFPHQINNELCLQLNAKMHISKTFEKKRNSVDLSLNLLSSSKVCTAFIIKDKGKKIELRFPSEDLRYFPKKSLSIMVSNVPLSLSVASLKLNNMAEILSQHINFTSSASSTSKGEIKAVVAATDSSSDLYQSEYGFDCEHLYVEIPSERWQETLQLIKMPTLSLSKAKRSLEVLSNHSVSETGVVDTNNKWLYAEIKVRDPWKTPGIVTVWLTWSMRGYVLSPTIQLVELSPLIRFCIQHCSRPAECFSDPNLSQASKKSYKNIEQYITLWKTVLLAEAAEKSIREKGMKPTVLCDVSLKWPQLVVPDGAINELYYVTNGKVKMIIPINFARECSEFLKIQTGSLVCVRCEDGTKSGTKAVFHFVVDYIEKNAETDLIQQVFMQNIGDSNCRISEDMKHKLESKEWNYEVQITPMSVSYR